MDKVATRVRATPSPIPFIQVPHIVRPIKDVHVAPGDSASFEVVFSGPPLTQTTWLVNGRKVSEDGNFQVLIVLFKSSSLDIHEECCRLSDHSDQQWHLLEDRARRSFDGWKSSVHFQ